MVVATAGAIVLACAHHFAALFIGLELLSVSLYGLVAYPSTAPLIGSGHKIGFISHSFRHHAVWHRTALRPVW